MHSFWRFTYILIYSFFFFVNEIILKIGKLEERNSSFGQFCHDLEKAFLRFPVNPFRCTFVLRSSNLVDLTAKDHKRKCRRKWDLEKTWSAKTYKVDTLNSAKLIEEFNMQPRSQGSRPAGTDRRETWERAHGTYSQAYTIEIELLSKLLTYLLLRRFMIMRVCYGI